MRLPLHSGWLAVLAFLFVMTAWAGGPAPFASKPYGIESRPASKAFLNIPDHAIGKLPGLLSETGAFASPAEFVNARLMQDWLEEKIEEAFLEPATPLTSEDWAKTRQRLDESIAKKQ